MTTEPTALRVVLLHIASIAIWLAPCTNRQMGIQEARLSETAVKNTWLRTGVSRNQLA